MVTYPPYGYKCFAGFENSRDVTEKHFFRTIFLTTDHRKGALFTCRHWYGAGENDYDVEK
jgi:hypothetical protein